MDKLPPSAQETAETTRRGFFKTAVGALLLICGAVVTVPLIGSFIGPSFRKRKAHWIRVADVAALPAGRPLDLRALDRVEDAYIRENAVRHLWVVKGSGGGITVFSPICPHLGCHYDWNPRTNRFECPCHGSVYDMAGRVLGGPAPRPLDTLPTKIESGTLYVEWEVFKSGTPQKVPA